MADNALSSSSTIQAVPLADDAAQPRKSAIRFSSDNGISVQHAKPSRRDVSASDEATPIAKSNEHVDRSYNTSATTLAVSSLQLPQTTSAISHQSSSSNDITTEAGTTWYKRLAEKYGSVTLENKASVARDHLALERTFLAWLRTSLSFASIGIAITQLFRLNASTSSSTSKRALASSMTGQSSSSALPFSPYLGHAIPPEIIPYLQHAAAGSAAIIPTPEMGPTLLDQMLGLSADGSSVHADLMFTVSQATVQTADRLRHVGKPLGATFIGVSVIVLLVGFQRYFEAQHWIIHGKFPASRASITLVAFVATALVVASLIIIVVIQPTQYES